MSSPHPSDLLSSNDSLDDVVKRLVAKIEKHDGRAQPIYQLGPAVEWVPVSA